MTRLRPGRRQSFCTQPLSPGTRPTLSVPTLCTPALTPALVLPSLVEAIQIHGHWAGSLDTCPQGALYFVVVLLD